MPAVRVRKPKIDSRNRLSACRKPNSHAQNVVLERWVSGGQIVDSRTIECSHTPRASVGAPWSSLSDPGSSDRSAFEPVLVDHDSHHRNNERSYDCSFPKRQGESARPSEMLYKQKSIRKPDMDRILKQEAAYLPYASAVSSSLVVHTILSYSGIFVLRVEFAG